MSSARTLIMIKTELLMSILKQLQEIAQDITVLYVEDDEEIREQTGSYLKRFFNSVEVCKNGKDGLDSYALKHHDIVITDIKMPIMDGLEMSLEIKKLNRKAEIILITAFSETELLLKAIDIGVEQYIIKPINAAIFASTLIKTIRLIKLEKHTQILHQRIQNILNFQDNLLFVTDLKHINSCNKAFLKFFRLESHKEMREKGFCIVRSFLPGEGYMDSNNMEQFCKELLEGGAQKLRVKLLDKSENRERIFTPKISMLPQSNEYIVSLTDITDFEAHYKDLEFKATHDTLTRIYNRLKFESVLEGEVSRALRYSMKLSLVIFDVDDFKKTNEIYGNEACDLALIKLCEIVSGELGRDDLFARIGDDEFAVLFPSVEFSHAFSAAEKLRKLIAEYDFQGVGRITCSFGVSYFQKELEKDTLLRDTQHLLKIAKESGKNCVKTHGELENELKNELYIKEQELILKQFDLLNVKNEQVTIYAFYKGLSISNSATIESIDERGFSLSLSLPKKKIAILIRSPESYLWHPSFSSYVRAELLRTDMNSSTVALGRLSQVLTAPIQRKMLRLMPEGKTEVVVYLQDDTSISATLLDISLNSLSIECPEIKGLLIGSDVKTALRLKSESSDRALKLNARVLKIIKEAEGKAYKVVLSSSPLREEEEALLDFLSKRQIEIIREVNNFIV